MNGAGYECRNMTGRTTSRTVIFRHPFMVEGFGQVQPGSYIVETEEELLDTLHFQAWKRASTIIRVGSAGRIQDVPIDPEQLDNALLRDRTQGDSSPPLQQTRE
jgi:hypothetical protein